MNLSVCRGYPGPLPLRVNVNVDPSSMALLGDRVQDGGSLDRRR